MSISMLKHRAGPTGRGRAVKAPCSERLFRREVSTSAWPKVWKMR